MNLDLFEETNFERALGVQWDVKKDNLGFKTVTAAQPATKRGVLSNVFSIYDPFGLAAPVILPAKRIFQLACHKKLDWDEPLPDSLKKEWNTWQEEISRLTKFQIPRWLIGINKVEDVQLHIFAMEANQHMLQ